MWRCITYFNDRRHYTLKHDSTEYDAVGHAESRITRFNSSPRIVATDVSICASTMADHLQEDAFFVRLQDVTSYYNLNVLGINFVYTWP